jgi:hypothetical protein
MAIDSEAFDIKMIKLLYNTPVLKLLKTYITGFGRVLPGGVILTRYSSRVPSYRYLCVEFALHIRRTGMHSFVHHSGIPH